MQEEEVYIGAMLQGHMAYILMIQYNGDNCEYVEDGEHPDPAFIDESKAKPTATTARSVSRLTLPSHD